MATTRKRTRRGFGSIRRLPSKRYQASYQGPDGARHKAPDTFATRGDAEGWLSAEKRLIDLGAWRPPELREKQREAAKISVGEWLEQFHSNLEHRPEPLRASTMQNYRRVTRNRITEPLEPGDSVPDITRLASLPLVDLTKGDVYRWWDGVLRAYPDDRTTNQQAYKRLRAACAEAVRREMISTNPVEVPEAGKRVKPAEKYLPEDWELQAILSAIPARYKALTSLMLFHGLRIGEALALELRHVKVDPVPAPWMPRVTVTVEQNAQRIRSEDGSTYMLIQPPKSDAGYREVPIIASHVPIFQTHLAEHAPPAPTEVKTSTGARSVRLFTVTRTGELMFDTSYRSVLERAEIKAGVTTEIDPHCGRNWLITRLAEQGAHLKEIGQLLGQEDVSTILDVYMKVRAERTVSLMERVNASVVPGRASWGGRE